MVDKIKATVFAKAREVHFSSKSNPNESDLTLSLISRLWWGPRFLQKAAVQILLKILVWLISLYLDIFPHTQKNNFNTTKLEIQKITADFWHLAPVNRIELTF